MDTRRKIGMAHAPGRPIFVAYFDILTPPLIRRLCELSEPVTALVLDPPNSILPAGTRAELAASLVCVAAVIPVSGNAASLLQSLQPANIIHWEREDALRTAELVDHVRTLHDS
jgi:hypothetical protein